MVASPTPAARRPRFPTPRIWSLGATPCSEWGAERSVQLHFFDPGKPTQNAQIESLNGKSRDELLNALCFMTIFEAGRRSTDWRQDYDEARPLRARLSNVKEFANAFLTNQSLQLLVAWNTDSRSVKALW